MKKLLILNGPPNSGKDTLADLLVKREGFNKLQFKDSLFNILASTLGMTTEEFLANHYSREDKENPIFKLVHNGDLMSPRQALIHMSENVIKKEFGENIFGINVAKRLKDGWNVTSDGGFVEELEAIIDEIGHSNVIVVRIHRDDCSFENDSRKYLHSSMSMKFKNVSFYSLLNNCNIELVYNVLKEYLAYDESLSRFG